MSGQIAHLGERLQDLADNRLSGTELSAVEAHLAGCTRCRRELEALRRVKQAIGPQPGNNASSSALSAALSQVLEREQSVAKPPAPRRVGLARRWALAAGVAIIAATALLLWRNEAGRNSWTAEVARDFDAYRGAHLPLALRTGDPVELQRFFAAQHLGFDVHVFDLGKIDYLVEGGDVRLLDDRPTARFAYRGPDDARLLCEMFRGRMDELPPAPRSAVHNGVTFRVYRRDALTAVYWAEGGVLCVLVSDIDSDALIALAFEKAAPAA
jgi:anti-sigma factor RsiW